MTGKVVGFPSDAGIVELAAKYIYDRTQEGMTVWVRSGTYDHIGRLDSIEHSIDSALLRIMRERTGDVAKRLYLLIRRAGKLGEIDRRHRGACHGQGTEHDIYNMTFDLAYAHYQRTTPPHERLSDDLFNDAVVAWWDKEDERK